MPVIQITNTYKGDVLSLVQSCVPEGFTARTLPENSAEALMDSVADADYILASGRVRIDGRSLDRANRLKMIQRTGVGLDSLDLDAIRSRGIPLYVNRGVNAESVAEHTMLLILACLRRLPLLDQNSKSGVWNKQAQGITTYELRGKTVGVIGLGSIGRRVAELLRVFGAFVLYSGGHRLDPYEETALGVKWATKEEIFEKSDVITLHCALTEETVGMINSRAIARMKHGVVLINTARGGLIDEPSLLAALCDGQVAFAGLDVHAEEPYGEDLALVKHRHVISTPHVGGVTFDSFSAMMHAAMQNIAAFEAGNLVEIAAQRYL